MPALSTSRGRAGVIWLVSSYFRSTKTLQAVPDLTELFPFKTLERACHSLCCVHGSISWNENILVNEKMLSPLLSLCLRLVLNGLLYLRTNFVRVILKKNISSWDAEAIIWTSVLLELYINGHVHFFSNTFLIMHFKWLWRKRLNVLCVFVCLLFTVYYTVHLWTELKRKAKKGG